MSDEHARRLERLALLGKVSAAGQLLHRRVRTGSLDPERLVLAAHLGDPASLAIVGRELAKRLATRKSRLDREAKSVRSGFFEWLQIGLTLGFGSDPFWASSLDRRGKVARRELVEWARALELFDKEACVRVAVASARAVLSHAEDYRESCERGIGQAEAWLRCPCDEHATGRGFGMVLWDDDVSRACEWAGRSASAAWAVPTAEDTAEAARLATYAVEAAFFLEPDILSVIRSEVVSWALDRPSGG